MTTSHRNRFRQAQRATLALALTLAGASALAADSADFETIDSVDIRDILPAAFLRSSNFEIEPQARAADSFYRFTVTSDFGTYEVTSQAMLRIRLHELTILAELTPRLAEDDLGFDRSPGGRRGVGSEHVVDILANPIGTASQLLGNIQYNVEETFVGHDDARAASAPGSAAVDLNPDPHKRSAAAQLGVDVYSSNPQLQALLQTLAEARSGGESLNAYSPLIRNVFADDGFGSGVLDIRLESTLKNTSAEDLNARLVATLDALGVPERIRITFLTHPAYTPRTRLYFTTYVQLLGPLEHVARLFHAASSAQTEADALAYVLYARMLAFYQISDGGLASVITATRFPTLANAERGAVLALPLDYLAWSPAVADAAGALEQIRRERQVERFIVLLAGRPTARAQAELAARSVELKAAYSF